MKLNKWIHLRCYHFKILRNCNWNALRQQRFCFPDFIEQRTSRQEYTFRSLFLSRNNLLHSYAVTVISRRLWVFETSTWPTKSDVGSLTHFPSSSNAVIDILKYSTTQPTHSSCQSFEILYNLQRNWLAFYVRYYRRCFDISRLKSMFIKETNIRRLVQDLVQRITSYASLVSIGLKIGLQAELESFVALICLRRINNRRWIIGLSCVRLCTELESPQKLSNE